jgi:hypothetical protein
MVKPNRMPTTFHQLRHQQDSFIQTFCFLETTDTDEAHGRQPGNKCKQVVRSCRLGFPFSVQASTSGRHHMFDFEDFATYLLSFNRGVEAIIEDLAKWLKGRGRDCYYVLVPVVQHETDGEWIMAGPCTSAARAYGSVAHSNC